MWKKLQSTDLALLLLRVGLGGMMLTHGVPKLLKGPALWPKLGSAVEHLGIGFGHSAFGLAAVTAETLCSFLIIIGYKTRLSALPVCITMLVAAALHLGKGDPWSQVSHPIETGIGFLALLLAGPGRYAVDRAKK